jgi:hypothetical protein
MAVPNSQLNLNLTAKARSALSFVIFFVVFAGRCGSKLLYDINLVKPWGAIPQQHDYAVQ